MLNFIKIIYKFLRINKPEVNKVKYKIGNRKAHNSIIDTLIPQLVEIGDNFISAPGSIILAHDASLFLHIKQYRCEKTIIGDNVFLGANAIILPGLVVGDGAIIGAGSVVTKNVSPNVVVAGNPAKYICTVKEYIEKTKLKGSLFTPPDSFIKSFYEKKIEAYQIEDFQKAVLTKINNK